MCRVYKIVATVVTEYPTTQSTVMLKINMSSIINQSNLNMWLFTHVTVYTTQNQNFRIDTLIKEISLKIYQILLYKLKCRSILQCATTKLKSQKNFPNHFKLKVEGMTKVIQSKDACFQSKLLPVKPWISFFN